MLCANTEGDEGQNITLVKKFLSGDESILYLQPVSLHIKLMKTV